MIAAENRHREGAGESVTLKASHVRAFLTTFGWFFVIFMMVCYVAPCLAGLPVDFRGVLVGVIFGSALPGLAAAIFFTPRVIAWDEDRIEIPALLSSGRRGHTWRELEAYGSFRKVFGTFLIKFDDGQAVQIVSAGFRPGEWKIFQSYLALRFPDKKARMRFRAIPRRFRKG